VSQVPPLAEAYGPGADGFGELWRPPGEGPWPVVALLHGGFWRAPRTLELMRPLAADLAAREPLELDRLVVAGHSAGGHLALWSAARPGLPAGAPGAGPRVVPRLAVSLAGVCDLRRRGRRRRPGRLVELAGVDHMAVIDPASAAWAEVARRLQRPS